VSLGCKVMTLVEDYCGGVEAAIPSEKVSNDDLQETASIERIGVGVAIWYVLVGCFRLVRLLVGMLM
jgi:hypothetical protein